MCSFMFFNGGKKQVALLIFLVMLNLVQTKFLSKIIPLKDLQTPSRTMFIAKFDFGVGKGYYRFEAKQHKPRRQKAFPANLSYGLLPHASYQAFKQANTCDQKAKLYSQTYQIKWNDYVQSIQLFNIEQNESQEIYYAFLYDCVLPPQEFKNIQQGIDLKLRMMNNGSHFGEDQKVILPYALLVAAWIFILVRFGMPIIKTFAHRKPDNTRIVIYCGVLCLGVAYFYKLLHLAVFYSDGKGLVFLDIFYICLKYITQGIIVTVIVSIAWGWSVVHLKHDQSYIITGTLAALINIVGLVLNALNQEMEDQHHQYESATGIIVFIIRIVIFVIFVIGILKSMAQSVGKVRQFLKKFGIIGSIYILCWPTAVIFSQLFLSNHIHHEFITIVQQAAHMATMTYLCQIMSYPESQYRKISKKQEDIPIKGLDKFGGKM